MKLGAYEIPSVRLKPNCLEILKKTYDVIKGGEITNVDLAKLLGYTNPRSGGFYENVHSLLLFALIEGRGKFRVTDIGKQLAYPPSDEYKRNTLLKEAVFNVPLWKEIFKRRGKKIDDEFWYTLQDITKAESPDIHKVEKQIRRWYLEDILLVPDEIIESDKEQNLHKSN
jgi:hypothetical protein